MELITQGFENEAHIHRRAQLIMTVSGLVTCQVAKGLWMVPPQTALWIPGEMEHSVRAAGKVEIYVLFAEPEVARDFPAGCCAMAITPLLREMVIAVSRLPPIYDVDGPPGRLVRAMLDQFVDASVEDLHLPLPTDHRLRGIAGTLIANPSDRATIAEWARRVAMSERTLYRRILQDTGMSFSRWRQQFQIMYALEQLAEGRAVQTIAFDLGYESVSAFITMFKKTLGQPPAQYFATRRSRITPQATGMTPPAK